MAISPVCLVLLGALCLANAAPSPAQPNLASVARYLYESLNQAQAQQFFGLANIGYSHNSNVAGNTISGNSGLSGNVNTGNSGLSIGK